MPLPRFYKVVKPRGHKMKGDTHLILFRESWLSCLPLELLVQILHTSLGYTPSGLWSFTSLIQAYPFLNRLILVITDVEYNKSDGIISNSAGTRVTIDYYLRQMSMSQRSRFPLKLLVYSRCDDWQLALLNNTGACHYARPMSRDTAVLFRTDPNSPVNRMIMEKHCSEAHVPVVVHVPSPNPSPNMESMKNHHQAGHNRNIQFSLSISSIDIMYFNKGLKIDGVFSYALKDFKVVINNCAPSTEIKMMCSPPKIEFMAPDLQSLSVMYSGYWTPVLFIGLPGNYIDQSARAYSHLSIVNTNWSEQKPYGIVCEHTQGCGNSARKHLGQAVGGFSQEQEPLPARPSFRNMCLIGVSAQFVQCIYWPSVELLFWKRLSPLESDTQKFTPDSRRFLLTRITAPRMHTMKIFSVLALNNELDPIPFFDAPLLERATLVALEKSERAWDLRVLLSHQSSVKSLKLVHLSTRHVIMDLDYPNLLPVFESVESLALMGYNPLFMNSEAAPNAVFKRLEKLTLDICAFVRRGCVLEESVPKRPYWWIRQRKNEIVASDTGKTVDQVSIQISKGLFPMLTSLNLKVLQKNLSVISHSRLHIDLTVPSTVMVVSLTSLVNAKDIRINNKPVEMYTHKETTAHENTVWLRSRTRFGSECFALVERLCRIEDPLSLEESIEKYYY